MLEAFRNIKTRRVIPTDTKGIFLTLVSLKSSCIKIGYSEPTRAESREGTSTLAESSRVFLGDVILDSDWLPTVLGTGRVCLSIF